MKSLHSKSIWGRARAKVLWEKAQLKWSAHSKTYDSLNLFRRPVNLREDPNERVARGRTQQPHLSLGGLSSSKNGRGIGSITRKQNVEDEFKLMLKFQFDVTHTTSTVNAEDMPLATGLVIAALALDDDDDDFFRSPAFIEELDTAPSSPRTHSTLSPSPLSVAPSLISDTTSASWNSSMDSLSEPKDAEKKIFFYVGLDDHGKYDDTGSDARQGFKCSSVSMGAGPSRVCQRCHLSIILVIKVLQTPQGHHKRSPHESPPLPNCYLLL